MRERSQIREDGRVDERAPRRHVPLAPLTTLRVGGPAARLVTATTPEEVVEAVMAADRGGDRALVLGGGSNVVVADEGFDGTVVILRTSGVRVVRGEETVTVTVEAGEPWDEVVARAVDEGWSGIETLSGIPGLTGATPIQNVGAYGQEVSTTVTHVTVLDRRDGSVRRWPARDCGFSYRSSVLRSDDRYIVLDVTFVLPRSTDSRPVRYAELARALGVREGDCVPLATVREAVLGLRRAKGMVVDPADPDSVSVGSFFTNPVLSRTQMDELDRRVADRLGPRVAVPRFAQADGRAKVPAAWLIERAGFARGYGNGRAAISSKHSLALINRGGASTSEVIALAREIRDGVRVAFGIDLINEPVLVGITL